MQTGEKTLIVSAKYLCAVALLIVAASWPAQSQTPNQGAVPSPGNQTANVAPGTQNAPPPPGGAQDSRRPARTGFAGGGAGYENADPTALDRGQKLYQANCSFCHGANAKGGEGGPNLVRSVLVLHDEHGAQIGQVVRNGRPDKGMPKFPLSDRQISDLATFLHDKVKGAALRGTYQILNIVTGNAAQGKAYFNGEGHCGACHSVTGDLAHIASRMEPVDLQQHIVMPRQGRDAAAKRAANKNQALTVTVGMASGQSFSGVLDHIDDFTVALTDDSGEYHSFTRDGGTPQVVIHDPLQAHTDMLKKYKDSDIHNLTAYLVTLK